MRSHRGMGVLGALAAFAFVAAGDANAGRIGRMKIKISPFAEAFVKKLASVGKKLLGPAKLALEAATALVQHKVGSLGALIRTTTGKAKQALRAFSLHFSKQLRGIAQRLARSGLVVGKGLLDRMRIDLQKALDRARHHVLTLAKKRVPGGLPNLGGFATHMGELFQGGMDLAKQIAQGTATRVVGQMAAVYNLGRKVLQAKVRGLCNLMGDPCAPRPDTMRRAPVMQPQM